MVESWPLRVYDPAGEIVAACRELETAIGLLFMSGAGATIWLGVSKSQKIYTLTPDDASSVVWHADEWHYGDNTNASAVELTAECLYKDWGVVAAVYAEDAECLGETWWQAFQEFVWVNADYELRELAEQEEDEAEMLELLKERIALGKTEEIESDLTTIRNAIRGIDDEPDPDGLPTLPSVELL